MKSFFAALFVTAVFSIGTVCGQPFSLEWQVLDGSVSTSAGSAFSLTGALGQPHASARLTGDGFSVAGGVTKLTAAWREHNSSVLRIEPRGADLLLAWPSSESGFQLQQSSSLISPNWNEVLVTPAVVGSENQITLPFTTGHRFFRLHKP